MRQINGGDRGDTKLKRIFALVIIMALFMMSIVVLSAPNVKAQNNTSDARVLSYSYYVAPSDTSLAYQSGDLVAVGEIQNAGSSYLTNVSLTGTAYDSSGNVLATGQGIAFVFHTAPGDRTPFYVDFPPQNSTGLDWTSSVSTVTVSVTTVDEVATPQYGGLYFIANSSVDAAYSPDSTYRVVGFIGNNGSETSGSLWVVTTFYDTTGKVVALNFTSIMPGIAPGENTTFWVTPTDNTPALSDSITNYNSVIDSLPNTTSTSDTVPTATPEPSSYGGILTIAAIAVVGVVIIIAITLLMLKKRQKIAAPPPPPPTS